MHKRVRHLIANICPLLNKHSLRLDLNSHRSIDAGQCSLGNDLLHQSTRLRTVQADRAAYVSQVLRALKPGDHVIMATFGSHGPT